MNQQKLLEWLYHDEYNDNNQQQGWNLVENAEKPGVLDPFIAGETADIALERAMIHAKEKNRREFSKHPNLQELKLASGEKQDTR
jgi:hypothetical protein